MPEKPKAYIVPKKRSVLATAVPNRGVRIIAITGTPGVGKTSLARELSLLTNSAYIDLNKTALKASHKAGFDRKRKVVIIDEADLYKAIKPLLEPNMDYFVDSHMAHLLPASKVSLCIVVHCSLKALKKRLLRRGYSPAKVAENLDAEALGICLGESLSAGHRVVEVDATRPLLLRSLKALIHLINVK